MAEQKPLTRILAWPIRGLVLIYRYGISSILPGTCRFEPTCSAYTEDALATHGAFKGGFLAAKRICRCHPWGGMGYDPVPPVNVTSLRREGSRES